MDGELPGYEGRVAEEEAELPVRRRRRERLPLGGDRIEGAEFDGVGEVVVGFGGQEESVEREKRREGWGVKEAAPRAADGVEFGRGDEREAEMAEMVGDPGE